MSSVSQSRCACRLPQYGQGTVFQSSYPTLQNAQLRYVAVETWHPIRTFSIHRLHALRGDALGDPDRAQERRRSADNGWQGPELPRIAGDSLTSLEVDSSSLRNPSLLAWPVQAVVSSLQRQKDPRVVRYCRAWERANRREREELGGGIDPQTQRRANRGKERPSPLLRRNQRARSW